MMESRNTFSRAYARLLELCDDSPVLVRLLMANALMSLTVMTAWVVCGLTHTSSLWLEDWLTLPGHPDELLRRPWTVVTYMFTQFHPLHFFFNILWLFWFGKILLMAMPQSRLLWLYLGGGLTGAAAFVATATLTHSPGMLTGGSAAVMAVMTAAAIRMPDRHVQFLLVGAVRLKWVAGAAVALTLLGIGGGGGGALTAHIAGALFGCAIGAFAPGNKIESEDTPQKVHIVRMPRYSSGPPVNVKRNPSKMVEVLSDRLRERHRLDELLDKITHSGYDSLSVREQDELRELSRRL